MLSGEQECLGGGGGGEGAQTGTDPETVSVSVLFSLSPSGVVNAAARKCVCALCVDARNFS